MHPQDGLVCRARGAPALRAETVVHPQRGSVELECDRAAKAASADGTWCSRLEYRTFHNGLSIEVSGVRFMSRQIVDDGMPRRHGTREHVEARARARILHNVAHGHQHERLTFVDDGYGRAATGTEISMTLGR